MEQIQLGYSLKDIPTPDDKVYLEKVIASWGKTDKKMRWKVHRINNPGRVARESKNTYGFPTVEAPPMLKADLPTTKALKEFQTGMVVLIKDISFNSNTNEHQVKLKQDILKIRSEKRVYMAADKTSNMYLVKPKKYNELLNKSVQNEYKKSSAAYALSKEKSELELAKNLELNDRVHRSAQRNCFVTLKDHKPSFRANPQCRLLNPSKPELGKVAKQMLERINSELRKKTNLKQWRRTSEVRDWFVKLENKQELTFVKFDVESFYPSISEALLRAALEWAETLVNITEEEKEVINKVKMSLLYVRGNPWVKRRSEWDVTMGSFDGAETCELVGMFMLDQLKQTNLDLGLYRDDGLGVTNLKGRPLEAKRQQIQQIFREHDLRVTITSNLEATDFLDIFLDLRAETFRVFTKEGDIPTYVHCQSNHPPSVLKNIGPAVNKRLSTLSASGDLFNQAKPLYQDALKRSKFNHDLKFEEEVVNEGQRNKRRRKRQIIWWNPPFSMNVKTNIGARFLALIDKCFPKDGPLGKAFNRSNLKLSYATCPNMKQLISAHNRKLLANIKPPIPVEDPPEAKTCNCNRRTMEENGGCPLQGKCLITNVVYQAEVVETKVDGQEEVEKYVGCTTDFKTRWRHHRKSFNNGDYKHETVLSTHIWDCKTRGSTYSVSWKILDRGQPFNPVTKICKLCVRERFYILRKPHLATLNHRQEIGTFCPHVRNSLLRNVKKVKVPD